tara:strand:+ start:95 stop:274 length:180 start_codon:yes stop_codon:yes gene_type:complete
MRKHRISYTVDGKEHSKVISYASTNTEAKKMILLSVKSECPSCDVEILSVEYLPTDLGN